MKEMLTAGLDQDMGAITTKTEKFTRGIGLTIRNKDMESFSLERNSKCTKGCSKIISSKETGPFTMLMAPDFKESSNKE